MIPIVLCDDCEGGYDEPEIAEADLCPSCAARLVKYRRLLAERYATLDRPEPTKGERQSDARSALDTSW